MAEQVKRNKYTLITGASKGIGRELAISSAKRKWNLILVSLPNTGLLELKDHICNLYNIECHILEIDLCKNDSAIKIFEYCADNNLNVNQLFNNAGIGYVGSFRTLEHDWVDNLIQLNIRSLSLLTHLFIPQLSKNKPANILNIGSLASLAPLPYKTLYSASKAFVYYFSLALQNELKKEGVHVCIVLPGSVKTNEQTRKRIEASGWKARMSSVSPEKLAEQAIKQMLQKKTKFIPGKFNLLAILFQKLLPERINIKMAEKMFKNQNIN